MARRRNSEIVGLIVGAILAAAGALLILLPSLARLEMMAMGYALAYVGLFLLLLGLITVAMFCYRAVRLRSMLAGQHVLAHWVYSPTEAEQQARRDLESVRAANFSRFLVVAGSLMACVVLFTLYGFVVGEGDNMPWFVGGMLAVVAIVAAAAFGTPYLQYRRARRSSHEAYIAERALYVNGALHTWDAPLGALDGVSLVEGNGPARLVFRLRARAAGGAAGYESYTVEVPVPRGKEDTARRIESHFSQIAGP